METMTKKIKTKYWYIIRVDGKEVCRGKNLPKNKYWEIKEANPGKRVSIAWDSDADIVVWVL